MRLCCCDHNKLTLTDCFFLMFFIYSQPQSNHDPNEIVVFEDSDHDHFRIPALIFIKEKEKKTFLAFAEKRTAKNGKSNDENAKNLVMRKGTLQGNSLKVPR